MTKAYSVEATHSNGDSEYVVVANDFMEACEKAINNCPYIGLRSMTVREIGIAYE